MSVRNGALLVRVVIMRRDHRGGIGEGGIRVGVRGKGLERERLEREVLKKGIVRPNQRNNKSHNATCSYTVELREAVKLLQTFSQTGIYTACVGRSAQFCVIMSLKRRVHAPTGA